LIQHRCNPRLWRPTTNCSRASHNETKRRQAPNLAVRAGDDCGQFMLPDVDASNGDGRLPATLLKVGPAVRCRYVWARVCRSHGRHGPLVNQEVHFRQRRLGVRTGCPAGHVEFASVLPRQSRFSVHHIQEANDGLTCRDSHRRGCSLNLRRIRCLRLGLNPADADDDAKDECENNRNGAEYST